MAWLFDVAMRAATLYLIGIVFAASPVHAANRHTFGLRLELRYLKQDKASSVEK